jgi:hypothetical protein
MLALIVPPEQPRRDDDGEESMVQGAGVLSCSRAALAAWLLPLFLCCASAMAAEGETALESQLRNVVTSWASAWQSGRDDVYFLHYHPGFVAEDFPTREAWESRRRERILEPEDINISLREFSLQLLGDDLADVRFTLTYRRPGYADRTRKSLLMKRNGELWQILREVNLVVERLPPGE